MEAYEEAARLRDQIKEMEKKQQTYLDALDTYYRLKNEYETAINKKKMDIMKKSGLGWREKRVEYRKWKPKCVNCKRSVGTLFLTTTSGNLDKFITATCGDREKPCPLNIKLKLDSGIKLDESIRNDQTELSSLKKKIITDKNDLLFGYISSEVGVFKFDELRQEMEDVLQSFESTNELYLYIIENPVKKKTLEEKQKAFFGLINNMKEYMEKYNREKNILFAQEAVSLYVHEILPIYNEIMKLKYKYTGVEVDDSGMYHLIEKPITLRELELGNNYEIIDFQLGMR
jgi:hypothetical protein